MMVQKNEGVGGGEAPKQALDLSSRPPTRRAPFLEDLPRLCLLTVYELDDSIWNPGDEKFS